MDYKFLKISRWTVRGLVVLLGATFQWAVAQTPPVPLENYALNRSVLRWAEGTYDYKTKTQGRLRGTERFMMTVHADGTRTMMISSDFSAHDISFAVMLRVERSLRPLEAFLSTWTRAGFKGSTHILVNRLQLTADSNGPGGHATQAIDIPGPFALVTHPIAADSWRIPIQTPIVSGPQSDEAYVIDASPTLTKPMFGLLRMDSFQFIRKERISVPAGTFNTLRYRLSGAGEVWITPEDHILVRMLSTNPEREDVLTTFHSGKGGAK